MWWDSLCNAWHRGIGIENAVVRIWNYRTYSSRRYPKFLLSILGFVREPLSTAWVIFITPGQKN